MGLGDALGVEWPLIQAPMAGAQGAALAAAVCEAGALGSLPCAMLTPESLSAELAALRRLTDRPFNVNFFCHAPPLFDAARDQRWRAALAPWYEKYGIDPSGIVPAAGRAPFDERMLEVIEAWRPPVVSFHFGLPRPALLDGVKEWGAVVMSTATTVDEARYLEDHGADVVIAQGIEAGGHRGLFLSGDLTGQLPLRELLARIADAVRLPVVAAGGIAGPKDVAEAMALGASGVQAGTVFLLCDESGAGAVLRAAVARAGEAGTALTRVFTGRPARGVVNLAMRELGPFGESVPDFPLAVSYMAPLRAPVPKRRATARFPRCGAGKTPPGAVKCLPPGSCSIWWPGSSRVARFLRARRRRRVPRPSRARRAP